MRGTNNKNRQQIQDETDRLKAQISMSATPPVLRRPSAPCDANFADSLRLTRELLREPSFPATEFEQLRQQRIAARRERQERPGSPGVHRD